MPSNKQKWVLICDDEPIVIENFERAFAGQDDYALDTARTVRAALEKLSMMSYDVIVLDMKIENTWSGMQIVREIKRLEIRSRNRGQPLNEPTIVLMSGSVPFSEFMVEAEALGVWAFMHKITNFTPEYIRNKLNRLGIALMPPESKPLTPT